MVHIYDLRLWWFYHLSCSIILDGAINKLAVLLLKGLNLMFIKESIMLELPFNLSFLNLKVLRYSFNSLIL